MIYLIANKNEFLIEINHKNTKEIMPTYKKVTGKFSKYLIDLK